MAYSPALIEERSTSNRSRLLENGSEDSEGELLLPMKTEARKVGWTQRPEGKRKWASGNAFEKADRPGDRSWKRRKTPIFDAYVVIGPIPIDSTFTT